MRSTVFHNLLMSISLRVAIILLLFKTREGIHYLVFHDIFNDEEGYGALSFMDDYLLNSSGEITKQVPVNIESYSIIAAKSKQVDNRELYILLYVQEETKFRQDRILIHFLRINVKIQNLCSSSKCTLKVDAAVAFNFPFLAI